MAEKDHADLATLLPRELSFLRYAQTRFLRSSAAKGPMPRKPHFPPEADTKPDSVSEGPETRRSGPAPKSKRDKAEAPTIPPPRVSGAPRRKSAGDARSSGVRGRKPGEPSMHPAATVDEVTADLSKDPRRERDGDEEDE